MEMALKQGHSLPEGIKNHQELLPGLEFYMESFAVLCDSRANEGLGIPYSEKLAYCEAEGVRGEDRDDFIYLVSQLDVAYVKYYREKSEREREAKQKKNRPPVKRRG